MRFPIEIHLENYEAAMLRNISAKLKSTRNVAAYSAIAFAEYCTSKQWEGRLAFRNEKLRRQKDLYVGKGIHVNFLEEKDKSEAVLSLHIEETAGTMLDKLVGAGFATSRQAAINRAIWLYRDVVDCIKGDEWMFVCIGDNIKLIERSFAPDPVAEVDAIQASSDINLDLLLHPTKIDEEKVRLYFKCSEILDSYKVDFANSIIRESKAAKEIVSYLGKTLALSSADAELIKDERGPFASLSNAELIKDERDPSSSLSGE